MKATGIVRRIDDLGRVVIPKEIRRTLRIREGDPLEIYTDTDGEVIFKKYSPIGEISEFASEYADVLARISSLPTLISDRDHIVERRITPTLEDIMEERRSFVTSRENRNYLYPIEGIDKPAVIAYPIIASGDVTGSVIMLSDNSSNSFPTETEIKLAQTAAAFLGKQMEE